MANISEFLQKIKEARYGRDVRSSIHDGIKAINEEVEANTLASNEAVESANNAAESADISARQATESANLAQASASSAADSATSAESANNTVNTFVAEKTTEMTEALNNVQTQADTRLDSAEQKYNELSEHIQKQVTDKIGIDDTQASTTTTYSSDKIDKLLEAIGGVAGLDKEIVQELPTSDIKDNTLYLVPSTTSETNNVYDEYIYIDGSWEIIGSTAVDLTNYYKKNEVDTLLEDKVNKEEGKGLFSGSYADLKDKPGIPSVVDNLTSTSVDSALSANQGKILDGKIDELKNSVSDGKTLVASAITEKGVATNPEDTFQTMADNIIAIESGGELHGALVAGTVDTETSYVGNDIVLYKEDGIEVDRTTLSELNTFNFVIQETGIYYCELVTGEGEDNIKSSNFDVTGDNIVNKETILVEIKKYILKTITVRGAVEDTITVTAENGDVIDVVVFDSGSYEGQVQVLTNGACTFTSSVAVIEGVNYTKTVQIDDDVTEVNVMPDGLVLYWFGYISDKFDLTPYAYAEKVTYQNAIDAGKTNVPTKPTVTQKLQAVNFYMKGTYASNLTNGNQGIVGKNQKIPLTNYTAIKCYTSFGEITGVGQGFILVTPTFANEFIANARVKVAGNVSYGNSAVSEEPKLYSLDISDIEGEKYVFYSPSARKGKVEGILNTDMSALWIE